jgi:hypothetical protein
MATNYETIEDCCSLVNQKMKRLLEKYHNTDVKIVEKTLRYISKISIEYNVPENEILNYPAYEWYYGNFLTALLSYMFVPWVYHSDKKLSHVQLHDLIYHIYKLVVNKQCKRNVINYYDKSFVESLDFYAIRDDVYDYAKRYIPLLKIVFKYGPELINKQQQLVESKVINIFRKRRALRIISNWVASNIIWNPDHKICQNRMKLVADEFYALTLEQQNKNY